MDAKTSRTAKIRAIVAAAGGPTRFAETHPGEDGQTWTQAQVSQWISEGAPKAIGHRLAREIERRTGLPSGWLDQASELPHGDAVLPSGSQRPTLRQEERELVTTLLSMASPRSRRSIQAIVDAAESGRLTEGDVDLLAAIAQRLQATKT